MAWRLVFGLVVSWFSNLCFAKKPAGNGLNSRRNRYQSILCLLAFLCFVPKICFAFISVWTGTCCGSKQSQFINDPQALVDYFQTTPPPNADPSSYTTCSSGPSSIGQSCYVYAWGTYITYNATIICPSGYILSGSNCTLPVGIPDPHKNTDKPDTCAGTNPCNAGTGNKFQSELDYIGSGAYPLKLERFYNSGGTSPTSVEQSVWGNQWRSSYDRSISYASNGSASTATVQRQGGTQYYFNFSGGNFVGDADVIGTLVRLGVDSSGNPTGWTFTNENNEIESYDATGKLLAITNLAGQVQTLTYSNGTTGVNGGYILSATGVATSTVLPAGFLIRVADPAGRTLQFGYDSMHRVVKMTDPGGGVYLYSYKGVNITVGTSTLMTDHLTSVTYPDSKQKTYLYAETTNVSATPNSGVSYTDALTGIIDENGNRYASWTYDSAGRAASSEHGAFGSGIDHVGLVYTAPDINGNSSTSVTDPLGTPAPTTSAPCLV